MLDVGILGVTASTCVRCLTDNICNFFRSFHLWIICHRCYSAADVLLKVCMVHGLYSTPRDPFTICYHKLYPHSDTLVLILSQNVNLTAVTYQQILVLCCLCHQRVEQSSSRECGFFFLCGIQANSPTDWFYVISILLVGIDLLGYC